MAKLESCGVGTIAAIVINIKITVKQLENAVFSVYSGVLTTNMDTTILITIRILHRILTKVPRFCNFCTLIIIILIRFVQYNFKKFVLLINGHLFSLNVISV